MTTAQQPGLYRRLTVRLLLPMLILVSGGGALGVYAATKLTSEVFDRWLLDAAVSLAQQVTGDGDALKVDMPRSSQSMLAYDEIDQTFFAVENHGALLLGTAGIPHFGAGEVVYPSGRAFDAEIGGKRVRVASAHPSCSKCDGVTVLVAETLLKRERVERSMLWIFSPMVLLLLATMMAILMTVRRTVQPLESLAAQWNRESHESLRPIPTGDLPRELTPFSTALNDLLARIRQMLVRERRFAATAAHQLRTPLAALRLGLDRARRAPDLDATRAVLSELDVSTDHTARMVQQLLLLGRLDPEQYASVELQPVDLCEVVRDVCSALSDIALARNVEIEVEAPEHPVMVLAQSELLAEAIANLVDNALKASPPRGLVRLALASSAPGLEITDNGPGIPLHEREAVFEHFVRGEQATWSGSGLGLSIVRDIAKLHRATISISDAPTEHGTRIRFEFPQKS
jgi:two-component system, OmpR family, sensor histidine kinase TctE